MDDIEIAEYEHDLVTIDVLENNDIKVVFNADGSDGFVIIKQEHFKRIAGDVL